MYDSIIIGAGPAGMSAALYLARKKMNIILISDEVGGQTAKASHVENYLGIEEITGPELIEKFTNHVKKLAIVPKNLTVKKIIKTEGGFEIETNNEKLQSKSVIIASGKTPRKLGVPGEEKFIGKGVSYCAICDGPLFGGKIVAVIGGGNSALDSALEMEKYAKKVYIVNLNEDLQGDEILKERFAKSEKSQLLNLAKTTEILGDDFVSGLKYEDQKTKESKEIKCDGIFVEIGWQPSTDFASELVKLNQLKEIEVDKNQATSAEGIFACGDVTDTPYKQIIIAAGMGATAALACWRYLVSKKS